MTQNGGNDESVKIFNLYAFPGDAKQDFRNYYFINGMKKVGIEDSPITRMKVTVGSPGIYQLCKDLACVAFRLAELKIRGDNSIVIPQSEVEEEVRFAVEDFGKRLADVLLKDLERR
jgi:hypothetical protein